MPTKPLVDTTPCFRRPPQQYIESAKAAVPEILAQLAPGTKHIAMAIVACLLKLGHSKAAAHWAIHDLVSSGLLVAEARRLFNGDAVYHPGEADYYSMFAIEATDRLWTWWEKSPEAEAGSAPEGLSWQEVAQRLERLRSQGEPFTSQSKLAKDFGCSSGTVNKAIRLTKSLHGWAKHQAAPKAQSITPVVTDGTAQTREPDPADDAAIREYLERDLTLDERAFFNGLSREDQIAYLDDPDKHDLDQQVRILGRKP